MSNRFKFKNDFEKNCPLDYFFVEKFPIPSGEIDLEYKPKYIEKYKAILIVTMAPMKPISKLLNPNDY